MEYINRIVALLFMAVTSLGFSQSNISKVVKEILSNSQNKFETIKGNQLQFENGVFKFECKLKVENAITNIYKAQGEEKSTIFIVYDNTNNKAQNEADAMEWQKELRTLIIEKNYDKIESGEKTGYSLMAGFAEGAFSPTIIMIWEETNIQVIITSNIINSEKIKEPIPVKKEETQIASTNATTQNNAVVKTSATSVASKPEANLEDTFKKDLDAIINDAATGFRESKGGFSSKSWIYSYNYSNKSIFNSNDASSIVYHEQTYLKATESIFPEEYYFFQGFDSKNNSGIFVYNNVERIFDGIMVQKNLKKKIVKHDKQHKDRDREIDYLDKNKRRVLSISFNVIEKTASISVYSDLRPDDLPTYYGCLVLYNIQMNSVVSANTYYVYGKEFKGADYLYNAIRSKMDGTSQRIFSKYEWKPNAGNKQIDDLMKSLNVRENGSKVDPDGNNIN